MSKRDRIAIVLSLGWALFGYLNTSNDDFLIWMIPVFIYWAYRFIKKD